MFSVHLALVSLKHVYVSYNYHVCILGTLVDRTPSKPLSPCYPGRRISRGEYLESAWQEGDPQHLLKGFDLGGIEDPVAHSSLTVVQEHGHMS